MPLPALVRAYRSTGAEPPFGDPRRAHGVAMEGYFWRFTDVGSGRVVVALCGVNRAADGSSWATVALAGHPGGWVHPAAVAPAAADATGLGLEAGGAFRAGPRSVALDLGEEARLEVRLRDRFGWPRRAFGGLGPAQSLPGLGQYWHPHLLAARVEGWARVGGEEIDLGGAVAYAEKNWGAGGFPGYWWWGQAHGFERDDACVAFAGGEVRLAGGPRLEATALVVRLGDDVIRLSMPLGHVRGRVARDGWSVRGVGARHVVELEGEAGTGPAHVLPVPLPAERRNLDAAHQHLAGRLRLLVRRRGRGVVFRGESTLAGLERGDGAG